MSNKIKEIDVTMTFTIGLGNVEIPSKVLIELEEIFEKGIELHDWNENFPEAMEWLNHNVRDRDAYNWGYGINKLEIQ